MNWEQVREQFPVTQNFLYFDMANKCPLPIFSANAIDDYIQAQQFNGGEKSKWFEIIADARHEVSKLIGCKNTEIAFTKNTSEGLNMAANSLPLKAGDTVLLNFHEHPNNIYCWLNLEKKGIKVKWFTSPDGNITVEDIERECDETTKVVALSSTNYAPGNVYDLDAIGNFCRERGIYTVIDAVQSIGVRQIDVHKSKIDILCGSGHKYLLCPHGVGLFYCREDLMDSLIPVVAARSGISMAAQIEKSNLTYTLEFSGDSKRFEIGNYNYLGITTLNTSLKFLHTIGMNEIEKRISYLSGYLIHELKSIGINVTTPIEAEKRAAIVCFDHDDHEGLYKYLVENNVILTMRRDGIRLSVYIYNNEDDIHRLVKLIKTYKKV